MITDNELKISNESYTHKDFYQIYPELLDLVKKITNIYDPESSNESDPGVVLLKLLAFIADKNNYNIDKQILEIFMSSCTQEDSMRKLCDLMGYNMHYYISASTEVSFMYTGTALPSESDWTGDSYLVIPAFSTLTDDAEEISFITTKPVVLNYKYETVSIPCIEGGLKDLNVNDDNILRISNLDDNLRFYLPEIQIAENGIWIRDAKLNNLGEVSGDWWEKVDNLNTQPANTRVWKFGYDSRKKLPYIQFPKDAAELITDGLYVSYLSTSGSAGNISAKKITKLSSLSALPFYVHDQRQDDDVVISDDGGNYLTIQNPSACLNGQDLETIDDAYNNFKKTVGTFDTLVTCRDYANAIYNMVSSEHDRSNLVSNVQVSDIRNELNKSNKIVTFNDFGLVYEDHTEHETDPDTGEDKVSITNFDLYLYPLNAIKDSYTKNTYENSFKPNTQYWNEIIADLEDYKTISHNICHVKTLPQSTDLYMIKNYYKLKAKIATTYKVSKYEGLQILNNIYGALYKKFNARNVDFGEEIPYDSILECIENADARIKSVSLDEPDIEPRYMLGSGKEYSLHNEVGSNDCIYKRLLAKNVLAGRVPLFDYDTRINYCYGQRNVNNEGLYGALQTYPYTNSTTAPVLDPTVKYSVTHVDTEVTVSIADLASGYKVKENENIEFIAPNFNTSFVYPAYVNYYFVKGQQSGADPSNPACNLTPIKGTKDDPEFADLTYFNTWIQQHPGTQVYRKAKSVSIDVVPGYLVDDDHYQYTKINEHNSGYYLYYLNANDPQDTLGENPSYKESCVPANTEYKLKNDDKLYINYTDSNDVVHNILYVGDEVWENGIKTNTEPAQNIIKPNFDLYDSNIWAHKDYGHKYAKTKDLFDAWHLPGMFSLDTSEQIDFRDFVTVKLDSPFKCYWITNSGKLFDDGSEQILNDGEYFFYTDNAMTSLVTLGSGTKLIFPNRSQPLTLSGDAMIKASDVANNGIGAFADQDWYVLKLVDKSSPFTCQEMQIITLGEGDILKGDFTNAINNTWQQVANPDSVLYNNNSLPLVTNIPTGFTWYVRSVLNLNVGPELTQILKENQSIKLYTSAWIYKGNDTRYRNYYVDPRNEETPFDECEEVVLTTTLKEFTVSTGAADICLRSSHLLQKTGGIKIPVKTVNTSGVEEDDVYFYQFIEVPTEGAEILPATESGGSWDIKEPVVLPNINSYQDRYTKISFEDYRYVKLPIYVPNGCFALVSVYYVMPEENTKRAGAFTYNPFVGKESGDGQECISLYESLSWTAGETGPKHCIRLKNGLNVIRVDSSCDLYLADVWFQNGTITFANMDVVHKAVTTTISVDSGLDYNLLGIDATECDDFVSLLKTVNGAENFYYNVPINNSLHINLNTLDNGYFWFNYNNICNKFVIGELDVDAMTDISRNATYGIQIAQSSKNGQW